MLLLRFFLHLLNHSGRFLGAWARLLLAGKLLRLGVRLWLIFLAVWLLEFLILKFAFIEACIVLLPTDILPVLRKDLHAKLVEGLLEVKGLLVDL